MFVTFLFLKSTFPSNWFIKCLHFSNIFQAPDSTIMWYWGSQLRNKPQLKDNLMKLKTFNKTKINDNAILLCVLILDGIDFMNAAKKRDFMRELHKKARGRKTWMLKQPELDTCRHDPNKHVHHYKYSYNSCPPSSSNRSNINILRIIILLSRKFLSNCSPNLATY